MALSLSPSGTEGGHVDDGSFNTVPHIVVVVISGRHLLGLPLWGLASSTLGSLGAGDTASPEVGCLDVYGWMFDLWENYHHVLSWAAESR